LHDYYTRYYKVGDAEGFNAVEDALRDSATGLTKVYEGAFERLNKRLKGYGYPPGQTTPDLRIRAEFSSQAIYQDHTRVYYASEHETAEGPMKELILPEKYNGLGYKNLIFMVLQLESSWRQSRRQRLTGRAFTSEPWRSRRHTCVSRCSMCSSTKSRKA
jgi:hypothetical protein